jgi:predicted MFS family arabinose efflux permease
MPYRWSPRLQAILVLAAVLALDGADKGTVAATASDLQSTFGIDNTRLGLLSAVTTLIGALTTLPIGALTDRVCRTRLLAGSITLWAVAMAAGALAPSYGWLLVSRLALGAVSATAGPTVASLTGDMFPAGHRARIYGFILVGEFAGTGSGFAVSGALSSLVGWRAAFGWLVVPGLALAAIVWRFPEPVRGAGGRVQTKQRGAARAVAEQGVAPYAEQVLHTDPQRLGLWWAVKYTLRVRTNLVVIVASALTYFYFAGVRTFVVLFAQHHYSINSGAASSLLLVVGVGAVLGAFFGGRFTDGLLERGRLNARILVPVVLLFCLPVLLGGGFAVHAMWLSVPLLGLGSVLLGFGSPAQDAARLDIIHPHLWGRSEAVRTTIRLLLEAAAPLVFGLVADHAFGAKVSLVEANHHYTAAQGKGLAATFLVFLVVLPVAGAITAIGLRTYPRDVATAAASLENTRVASRSKTGRHADVDDRR